MSANASLAVVLHAHLPFVRHLEQDWFLEEDWFFEAVTETYIPIIAMLERLAAEQLRPSLTISLSPTLCTLLEDETMEKRCRRYIETRLNLIEEEVARIPEDAPAARTAQMYKRLFEQALAIMDKYSGDLITPFKQFQQAGLIEVITSTATHALLPLLPHPESLRAQIAAAATDYAERFSRKSKGIWLAECAYDRRIAQQLQLAGIKYFFLENHALQFAVPRPNHGIFLPARIKGGVMAYARDAQSAKEVWSSQFGYPGDPAYREFYRDLGFDANYDYIKPYLHADGVRRSLGIKYHRITGKVELSAKEAYDPDLAAQTAKKHASDFLKKRLAQAEEITASENIRPVIVGTYDAELFGHWWFEGPQFLENVIRLIRQERIPLQMCTASECLDMNRNLPEVEPEPSSWGEGGYFEPWINDSNGWIYPKVNAAAEKMIELANRYQHQDITHIERRLLNQAAREVLLSQSSDWAFLMYINSHREYAEKRVLEHCGNFAKLSKMLADKQCDEAALREMELNHNILNNVDFRVFASASAF